MFGRNKNYDSLNYAHTLGGNAVTIFTELAENLETAVQLADQAYDEAETARLEAVTRQLDASEAGLRYGNLAGKLRELVG